MDANGGHQPSLQGPGGVSATSSIPGTPFTPQQVRKPSAAEEDSSKKNKIPWTPEEDEILKKAVEVYKGRAWKQVAELLPGRTHSQAAHRWQKVLDPKLKKGSWTQEEDEQLQKAVEEMGEGHWSRVAERVGTRNGKQCRERWRNQISPEVDKRPWSEEEDNGIIRLFAELGPKWAEIAKHFPGRTENAVKNRWNAKLGRPNGVSSTSPSPITPNALRRAQNKASDVFKPKRADAGLRRGDSKRQRVEDRQPFALAASPMTPAHLSRSTPLLPTSQPMPGVLGGSPGFVSSAGNGRNGNTPMLTLDSLIKVGTGLSNAFSSLASAATGNGNNNANAADSQLPPTYPAKGKKPKSPAESQQTVEALLALKASPGWQ